jgi:hypothetical protein
MHLTAKDIVDWLDETAAAPARARVEEHLATSCATCTERLEALRRLIATMVSDRTPTPPADVVAAAVRLFQNEPAAVPLAARIRAFLGTLSEEAGRLVFDSLSPASQAFAGARSVTSDRRLRFEGAGLELDISIEGHGISRRLIGQVLELEGTARPAADCRYLITAAGGPVAEGVADALGEFAAPIPDSSDLRVHLVSGNRAAVFELFPGSGDEPA